MNYLKIASLLEELAKEFRAEGPPAHSGSVAQPAAEAKPQEILLADIQKLGAALIRAERTQDLKAALAHLGLKNISSTPKTRFAEVHGYLNSL